MRVGAEELKNWAGSAGRYQIRSKVANIQCRLDEAQQQGPMRGIESEGGCSIRSLRRSGELAFHYKMLNWLVPESLLG